MTPSPSSSDPRPLARAADVIAARDRAWIDGIRQGDVAAFEALYRAYKNDLGGYVQSLLRSREAAEEIIHDLFLRFWEQRELWEPTGPLNTYLFRAARNRAISYLRHQRVEAKFRERAAGGLMAGAMSPPPPTADDVFRLREVENAVEQAVDALPDRCREVFRLNRYQGLSYAEVAQVLQISVKTVEMQMGRALTALRRRLAEWRE